MENPVAAAGLIIATTGVVIEFIAGAGMAFFPTRRMLPVTSPIALASAGGVVFFLGVIILLTGQWIG